MRIVNGFELPRVVGRTECDRLRIGRSSIRTELRRGNWQRLTPGVFLTRPDEPTRADWAEVGITLAGPEAAISGWDCLRAHGLGGPTPAAPGVLVLTRDGVNRVVGGVRLRRTKRPFFSAVLSPHSSFMALLPAVGIARAVADTALDLTSLSAARALVADAVQRGHCTLGDLAGELDAGPRNRSGLLRRALSDAMDGARSAAEADVLTRLTRAAVPAFEMNVPVLDEGGNLMFVVDVLWRELRAVLEVDSREHHFREPDWLATMSRHNRLTEGGLAVTHFAPSAIVRAGDEFGAQIRAWLLARAVELGRPLPTRTGVIRPRHGEPPPLVIGRRVS